MACWIVFGVDEEEGEGEGSITLVGGVVDALVAAWSHFGYYPTLVLKQTSDPNIIGTDGIDSRGRDMLALLHLDHFDEFDADEEDDRTLSCFLMQRSFAGDRGSSVKRDAEDDRCRCSRCRKRIYPADKHIGFESRGRHFIYHLECLGVVIE